MKPPFRLILHYDKYQAVVDFVDSHWNAVDVSNKLFEYLSNSKNSTPVIVKNKDTGLISMAINVENLIGFNLIQLKDITIREKIDLQILEHHRLSNKRLAQLLKRELEPWEQEDTE